jgi:peptidoglycan hydrolase CwlO-like protein
MQEERNVLLQLQSDTDVSANTLKAQRAALERDTARLAARERALNSSEEKLERRRAELDALSARLSGREAMLAEQEGTAKEVAR